MSIYKVFLIATRILHGVEILEYYPKIIPVKFGEILLSSLGDDVV